MVSKPLWSELMRIIYFHLFGKELSEDLYVPFVTKNVAPEHKNKHLPILIRKLFSDDLYHSQSKLIVCLVVFHIWFNNTLKVSCEIRGVWEKMSSNCRWVRTVKLRWKLYAAWLELINNVSEMINCVIVHLYYVQITKKNVLAHESFLIHPWIYD